MTTRELITSGQKRQISRFVLDAVERVLDELDLSKEGVSVPISGCSQSSVQLIPLVSTPANSSGLFPFLFFLLPLQSVNGANRLHSVHALR